MEENNYLPTPDEAGWFLFKKNKNSGVCAVRLTEEGRAFAITEEGDFFEIDDPIGQWKPIEDF